MGSLSNSRGNIIHIIIFKFNVLLSTGLEGD